jgi:hypothetical protein
MRVVAHSADVGSCRITLLSVCGRREAAWMEAAVVAASHVAAGVVLNAAVPEPYMVGMQQPCDAVARATHSRSTHVAPALYTLLQDEIFHVPQAQRFCAGRYGA